MKILIAYTTNAGSTEEVAQAIGEEMRRSGNDVDVLRLESVTSVRPYDGVIVGAPMILGWHRSAVQFIKKHEKDLAQKRVAYFSTLLSLTQTEQTEIEGVPVCVDAWVAKPPKNSQRLSIKERYAMLTNYLRPVLRATPTVHPISVALFGGKLELYRLKWWQMLFVMVIVQAQPGDLRNWNFIRTWAADVQASMAVG